MRTLLAGLFAPAVIFASPAFGATPAPRLAIGAIQGDKDSEVSRQLETALCASFECVPRSLVVTRGKVDVAKMRAKGVAGFLFGAVSTKSGAPRLWMALLTESERPSRTWTLRLQSGGKLASASVGTLVDDVSAEAGAYRGAAPAGPAGAEPGPAPGASATPGRAGAPLSFARVSLGAIQGDPKSLVSGPLRTEICARLTCVKRSLVTTRGRVDLSKMQAREVGGFLFGSVAKKSGALTLWLALITNSEEPTNTWSLPLTKKGSLPSASLKATATQIAAFLAVRAAEEAPAPSAPAPGEVPGPPPVAAEPAPTAGAPAPAVAAAGPAAPSGGSAVETGTSGAGAPSAVPGAAATTGTTGTGAAAAAAGTAAAAAATPPPAPPPAPQAAPPPSPPPAPPAQAAKTEGHRTEGFIPGILIGPKATATLLFPPNVMVGAELKVVGYVGASFEYGVFPRNTTISDYSLGVQSWSTGLRAYPFRGTFFVGAVLGSYTLTGTQSVAGQTATLVVKSLYLGPQIGWKWDFDFGLFFGLNLGYGFSLNYSSSLSGPTSDTLQTAKDNADRYLKTGVPIFTLLEMGWLF